MKLQKLSMLALAAFAVTGTTYAATPFQGFYANLGAGGINSEFDLNQTTNVTIPNTSVNLPSNTENYDNGGIGSIGVGYMFLATPSVVLGVEASADIESAKTTNNDSINENINGFSLSNTTTNKLKNSFAILFKPGFVFNQGNTLVYGLIGPRWGNFETSTSSLFQLPIGVGEYVSASAGNSDSGYETGLALGAGIQQYITNGFSIGLEYQYTDYGHLSTPTSSGPIIANGENVGAVSNNISSIKAQTNVLTLNLMYHF